jgi:D-glycero-D-manno-heptose 1,7-bisphosphate phosphatase
MPKPLPKISPQWTLFLDRDGVINEDNIHGYILNWEEFRFYPGVIEAFRIFATLFPRIFIVTNQRGVGKGVMSLADLNRIHRNMEKAIREGGGRIDHVYFCSATENSDPCRKPNPGMAFQAREAFPETDFTQSIMVGNTRGDMEFGRNIGAYNVYIHTREDKIPDPETVDLQCKDLLELAKALQLR